MLAGLAACATAASAALFPRGVLDRVTGNQPSAFERARTTWYTAPIDAIFPSAVHATLPNLGTSSQQLVRLVVADPAPCSSALDPGYASMLARYRCRTVLRATYANELATVAVTVGVAALDDSPVQAAELAGAARHRPAGPAKPAGLRLVAVPRTPAAGVSDDGRILAEADFPANLPYVAFVSAASTSGVVDSADLAGQAVQSGALGLSEQLLDRVLRDLESSSAPPGSGG